MFFAGGRGLASGPPAPASGAARPPAGSGGLLGSGAICTTARSLSLPTQYGHLLHEAQVHPGTLEARKQGRRGARRRRAAGGEPPEHYLAGSVTAGIVWWRLTQLTSKNLQGKKKDCFYLITFFVICSRTWVGFTHITYFRLKKKRKQAL